MGTGPDRPMTPIEHLRAAELRRGQAAGRAAAFGSGKPKQPGGGQTMFEHVVLSYFWIKVIGVLIVGGGIIWALAT